MRDKMKNIFIIFLLRMGLKGLGSIEDCELEAQISSFKVRYR